MVGCSSRIRLLLIFTNGIMDEIFDLLFAEGRLRYLGVAALAALTLPGLSGIVRTLSKSFLRTMFEITDEVNLLVQEAREELSHTAAPVTVIAQITSAKASKHCDSTTVDRAAHIAEPVAMVAGTPVGKSAAPPELTEPLTLQEVESSEAAASEMVAVSAEPSALEMNLNDLTVAEFEDLIKGLNREQLVLLEIPVAADSRKGVKDTWQKAMERAQANSY